MKFLNFFFPPYKKQKVHFWYHGILYSHTFRPTESDWWTGFTQHGTTFDIHFLDDEDENICVYLVIDGTPQTQTTIHIRKIKK